VLSIQEERLEDYFYAGGRDNSPGWCKQFTDSQRYDLAVTRQYFVLYCQASRQKYIYTGMYIYRVYFCCSSSVLADKSNSVAKEPVELPEHSQSLFKWFIQIMTWLQRTIG
jgi:hypothetical protein